MGLRPMGNMLLLNFRETQKQVFIPRGFAHGFVVLSNSAIVSYKVDNKYAAAYDSGIRWDDQLLNIHWKLDESEILISKKDAKLPSFLEFETPFKTKKMRVLITGSNGQLGSEIKELATCYKPRMYIY